jgi:Fe-S-cluster-containing dehydrogenase component
VLVYNPEKEVVQKCTLCAHRVDRGIEPFCVICCETEAILFGNLNDPASEVSRLVARGDVYTLKRECDTKPAIYYSPM